MSVKSSDSGTPNFFAYIDESLTCSISKAIHLNDKNTLQRILNKRKKKPVPLSADNRKWTALHLASSQPEKKECLEMLLRYGDSVLINLNDETYEGETALHIACENGCEENVLILLRKGCDPKKKMLDGSSPLHVAAAKGFAQIVDHLLDHPININDQDWQGFTPLHLAAMYGHLNVCRILLENGASVRLIDSDGNLPLHLACQNGYFDIVRLLLEHDFTLINYQNCLGITPPMLAVQNHNVQGVRYLLDNGAKTEVCNKDKKIALQFAAAGGNAEVLQLVLESTDMTSIEKCCLFNFLNVLDADGMFHSLACCAINSGYVECLQVLLASKLPKSILEAPYAENSGYCLDVYSPIAYLFSMYSESTSDTFDSFLRLLLKYEIISVGEFCRVLQVKWPDHRVSFANPFTVLFGSGWPHVQQQRYFELLYENGVTIDYCLQCYHDNSQPFAVFNNYARYYKPVLDAVLKGDVDTVRLFVSSSVILEPDELCEVLIRVRTSGTIGDFLKNLRETRAIYLYLIALKPVYHKLTLRRRDPCNFKRFPYPSLALFFPADEEFAKATLQQLCRTTIRQQLREPTLDENLRNFKAKISALPLPNPLKEYLMFKC